MAQISPAQPPPESSEEVPTQDLSSSSSARKSFTALAFQAGKRNVEEVRKKTEDAVGAPVMKIVMVFFTSLLTLGDVVSDIVVVEDWIAKRRLDVARALIAVIVANISMQLAATAMQNAKKPRLEQVVEAILVLTLLSPAVTAVRSFRNKHSASELMSPQYIHLVLKLSEIGFEAVPALLIQLLAILASFETSATISTAQLVSIITSALSISVGISTLFYGLDVSPAMRRLNSDFYGAFPVDSSPMRTNAAVFSLLVFTFCHVFGKCLGLALLWKTFGGLVAGGVFLGEFFLFCTAKFMQGDIVYWMPTDGLISTIFLATVLRFAHKLLVDFTGFVHFRHPYEMGGIYYSFSLFWSQLMTIISAVLYQRYYHSEAGTKIGSPAMYTFVFVVAATWLLFFCMFLLLIERRYVATLFSSKTGWQYTIDKFVKGGDFQKQDLFYVNRRHWRSIKQEVKDWSLGNWAKWTKDETRPDWFTADFVELVPDEFIPEEFIPDTRRRASIVGKDGESSLRSAGR